MKLLFDENLSRLLVARSQDIFPGSDHVILLGLETASDREVLRYASDNDFVIVTKDSDFNILIATETTLPGLIWIRTGNCSTNVVENLLRKHRDQIMNLSSSDTVRLLMLF